MFKLTCDIHGLFQPATVALSAGERDTDLRGDEVPFISFLAGANLRPINGVCDKSKVKSIVLPKF